VERKNGEAGVAVAVAVGGGGGVGKEIVPMGLCRAFE
jgi:hypothetical protein